MVGSDREVSVTSTVTPGIDRDRVEAWLAARVGLTGDLQWARIGGGRSNLTYRVTDGERSLVVRRPPLGDFPATAHDVLREARFLSGLAGHVPVPAVLATCDDDTITGRPLVVMEHLAGTAIATPEQAMALTDNERSAAGPAIVDALIALHRADPGLVGLPHLLDRRDFIARQLRRWLGNWQAISIRDLPEIARAHDLLLAAMPEQSRVGVVHGDFRLDNCLLADDRVCGILDWELATVGDPTADLGQLLVYWAEPGDEVTALENPPTVVGGFSSRADLAARYAEAFGDAPIEFQVAFNWWKTACIVEDVYSRVARGAMGDTDRSAESFAAQARRVAEHALTLASRLPAQ